jgi:hypothetical protein
MKTLTVKGLAHLLRELTRQRTINEKFEVWLASDEEGNSFSPLLDDSEVSVGTEGNKIILYPSSLHLVTEL